MSKQAVTHTPQVVATELDVSSATLRRWSDEFADHLSPEAGSTKGRSHRRYSEDDVAVLKAVKTLMSQGMTYAQVREDLDEQLAVWRNGDSPTTTMIIEDTTEDIEDSIIEEPVNDDTEDMDERDEEMVVTNSDETSLINANGSESSAIDFFTNTLSTLSDNQKSILNSQAANRELLGVLIQDNFNLKDENNRLRERLLDVERQMAQMRQDDEWRRESLRQELEAKIGQVQQVATEALTTAHQPQPAPEIKAVKSPPGCLGALFGGGGDVQIVSVPRRKGQPKAAGQQPSLPATNSYPPASSVPQQSPSASPSHPKPTAPPE